MNQSQSGPPGSRGPRLLLLAVIVGVILFAAFRLSPRGLDDWDQARLLRAGIVLVLVASALAARQERLGTMAKQAAIWLALGTLALIGYSYRDDLNGIVGRTAGTLVPSRGIETALGTMRYEADDSGQFYVDAAVNGVTIRFLLDTGASDIALSQRDARRLGLDTGDLRFTHIFSTANGQTRAAPVTLSHLTLGPFDADDVPAWVNEGDLDNSLLGMSFLSKLGRIEIRDGTLTLEQRQ